MSKYGRIAFVLALLVGPVLAQDNGASYEAVMRIASRMYCPVCENEPLDECRNATCIEWKNEIARQLEAGRTEEEIITYFVERYGQHVVGVPQDPLLRFLAFAAPIFAALLALIFGSVTFLRWRRHTPAQAKVQAESAASGEADDKYRAQLEQDLIR